MKNLTPYLNEISQILNGSDRPEITLLQRYETILNPQKSDFFLAAAGKLIEQDRLIRSLKLKGEPSNTKIDGGRC